MLNSYGVTAVFDAGAFGEEGSLHDVLQRLEEGGDLTVRIVGAYAAAGPEDIERAVSEAGAWGDRIGGERAVHKALNSIEAARSAHPDSSSRYTICHIEVITDEDLPRFAELDVIAQSTPLWASYNTYGEQFVGADQFSRFWRFNSLDKLGVKLTWGSDFPASGAGMAGMSPVLQMEIGHTRQEVGDPDAPVQPRETERIDIETAIRGYTINAAYQLHMEDEIGSLEVGKKADLVVLDRNLLESDPYDIHRTAVVMTLMDGEIVYEATE